MIQFEIDPSSFAEIANSLKFDSSHFPATSRIFEKEVPQIIENAWSEFLASRNISPQSANFQHQKTGSFSASVSTDNKRIEKIQTGTPAVDYDMKTTHPYGLKSRISKKGVPYLIVNFRWGTKEKRARWSNFIPQHYLNTCVKALNMTRATGLTHPEANFRGEPIERNEYENTNPDFKKTWDPLSEEDAWEVTRKNGKKHSSAGLVHVDNQYFTFRIISAKSPADSWLYHRDAVPGIDMIEKVEAASKPIIEQFIHDAILQDLK